MVVKKLPYKNIAGITPCPGGWLVLPARLAGITVSAEDASFLAARSCFETGTTAGAGLGRGRIARPTKVTVNVGASFRCRYQIHVLDQRLFGRLMEFYVLRLSRAAVGANLYGASIARAAVGTGPFKFYIAKFFFCHSLLLSLVR